MTDGDVFGKLSSESFEIGDMVEWTIWNDLDKRWSPNYGILIKIENKIKSNRIVSIATVKPINEPHSEIELFTVSLKMIKGAEL